jgi:flagellar motor switch protein FliM
MKDITVFKNTSLVVDKVVNLEPGDSLKLQSSSTDCDVVMSVLELS